jgi:hypothetical protein
MKKILTDAVAVGNATARAVSYRPRDPQVYFYPGKAWSMLLQYATIASDAARAIGFV